MKIALTERAPIWRLLRVEILALARSFFAFCAIVEYAEGLIHS